MEYKEQHKQANKSETDSDRLPEGKGFGKLGGKCEGIKKYKLVVTK